MPTLQGWFARRPYMLFVAPAFVLYSVFMVYPLLSSFLYSLYHWDGLIRDGWAGLANFRTVLTDTAYSVRFFGALWHNVLFFASTWVLQSTLGLFFAVIFHSRRRGLGVYQTVYFAPYTLSLVVVGFMWMLLLNPTWGVVNKALTAVGLGSFARPWLGDTETALPTIILINAWRWLGFPMLVFLAGLQAIPDELAEAARVDGASGWHAFRHVTLPLLAPSLTIITILTFIYDFNAFELIFVMQGSTGSPFYSTDVLGTFFYRTAFGDSTTGGDVGKVGLGSAVAVLMFLLICTVSGIGLRLLRRREVQL